MDNLLWIPTQSVLVVPAITTSGAAKQLCRWRHDLSATGTDLAGYVWFDLAPTDAVATPPASMATPL